MLGFQIGLHREVEDGEGSQAPGKTRPVGAACKETDGGGMAGPVGALGKVASGRCLARKGVREEEKDVTRSPR